VCSWESAIVIHIGARAAESYLNSVGFRAAIAGLFHWVISLKVVKLGEWASLIRCAFRLGHSRVDQR
jgi:hypothetical protein